MARKCSCCGKTGHNSRTCLGYRSTGAGPRLFGVQLGSCPSPFDTVVMRESFSVDCLPSLSQASSVDENSMFGGYLSDGMLGGSQAKKKGVPWTEKEHRAFLLGLEKLGKGDWRGISRNYVTTRTPTQVASHAQKYFLRHASFNKKKRRSSLSDIDGMKDKIASGQINLIPARLLKLGISQFWQPVSLPEQLQGEDHSSGSMGLDLQLGLAISGPTEKTQKPPVPRQMIVTYQKMNGPFNLQ